MHAWAEGCIESSIIALERSLALHQTQTATSFREFIIYQGSQETLALLATKQYTASKKYLCTLHRLFPYSYSLQSINNFADYLCFPDPLS